MSVNELSEIFESASHALDKVVTENCRLNVLVWNLVTWIAEHCESKEELERVLKEHVGMSVEEVKEYAEW